MSYSSQDQDDLPRLKIRSLISMYEQAKNQETQSVNKFRPQNLSPKISDFAWPERETSYTPKPVGEIKISDYVSVKSLIGVYQQISQQTGSTLRPRMESFIKKREEISNDNTYESRKDHSYTVPESQEDESSPIIALISEENFDVIGENYHSDVEVSSPISTGSNFSKTFYSNNDDQDSSASIQNGYSPLPESYIAYRSKDGSLNISLPLPKEKSSLKSTTSKNKNVHFIEHPTRIIETYNIYEYERGDDELDPVASSAQYEIEKKTEKLDKFYVTLVKAGKGLGLSIVGIGLGSETGEERLGIYIKALTPGGVAESEGSLKVQDQILEVDGVSLVGVSQKFAGETLKATGQTVRFYIGREATENTD